MISREDKKNKKKMRRDPREEKEFEQALIDLARVTRVMGGGKRMSFRACVAIGDRAGKVGLGLAKGSDVPNAVNKAVARAKKNIIEFKLTEDRTIPFSIKEKYKASRIIFKPVPAGKGIIAGGIIRLILNLVGIENIVAKNLGGNNKINNAQATINALKKLNRMAGVKETYNLKKVKRNKVKKETVIIPFIETKKKEIKEENEVIKKEKNKKKTIKKKINQ